MLINKSLVDRVMKENLWSEEYTLRVIDEYKKFMRLAVDYEVAPSYEIDQVWHAHILYTKDYRLSCKMLGTDYIDHNPVTKGGMSRIDPYPFTKETHKRVYREEPPADIWTDWKPSHYSYIDLEQNHIVKVGDTKTLFKLLIKEIFN